VPAAPTDLPDVAVMTPERGYRITAVRSKFSSVLVNRPPRPGVPLVTEGSITMVKNLTGGHGQRQRHVLRKALINCGVLALGTALTCSGASSAGAVTRPGPAKPGSLYLLKHRSPAHPDTVTDVQIENSLPGYNLCLDAETDSGGNPDENGDKVQLWTCNSGAIQQRWDIHFTVGSYGSITNDYGDHLCLDAEDDADSNPNDEGDKVQLWSCSGAANQQWTLESVTGGYYLFDNAYGDGLSLAAENDSGGDPTQCGDNMQVQNYTNHYAQAWEFNVPYSGCSS
jgi:Ricin-type beta-trefoil lectin domain